MKKDSVYISALAILVAAVLLQTTSQAIPIGTIVGVPGGTAAAAGTLGSFAMTPFDPDNQTLGSSETSVASPLGGNIIFSLGLTHDRIGSGWATWSNGYTGDVYYDSGTSLTLSLPLDTEAFYLYAEPNFAGSFSINAFAQDGTSISESVFGSSGASYFGFYVTGAQHLSSITVNAAADAGGFAIGEMGIAKRSTATALPVPEPGTWIVGASLLAVVAAPILRRKLS